jgi:predicted nucleic acid-binding protein
VPSKRIVNASPLILLGKIDRLDLLFVGVREVVVPATVIDEVGDPRLGNLPGWDQSLPPLVVDADVPIPPDIWRYALDPGESMVLALALSYRAAGEDVEVVLDERKGRRSARALGLTIIGTARLLILGKQHGQVHEVSPLLDELERQGTYLGSQLRRQILEATDE